MNGKKLESLIKAKGFTQRQFALMVGVTPAAISSFIAEKTVPSLALAVLMAKCLDVTVEDLM